MESAFPNPKTAGSIGIFAELTVHKVQRSGWFEGKGGSAALYDSEEAYDKALAEQLQLLSEEFHVIEPMSAVASVKFLAGWKWGKSRGH